MAVTTKLDTIEGNVRVTAENGYEARRYGIVRGLTGTASARLMSAPTASGMPAINSQHPNRSSCLLRDISCEIIDSESVKVTLLYADYWQAWTMNPNYTAPPSDNVIQSGASVMQMDTNKNYAGAVIYVPKPTSTIEEKESTNQGRLVSKFVAQPTITVTRLEYADPNDKACAYVGKVNAAGWNLRPYDATRTWLCTGITGYSTDNGATYQVTYTFVRCTGANYDLVLLWINPNTGNPQSNATENNGQKTWIMYETIDFDGLGL